jgi:hypothetical protein
VPPLIRRISSVRNTLRLWFVYKESPDNVTSAQVK